MPTRPTNMVKIIIIFPIGDSEWVTPILNPQVVYAETASNNSSFIGFSPSLKFNSTKLMAIVSTDSTIIAKALLMDSGATRLLCISTDSFPRAKAKIFKTAKATVVTFTPHPVEPGEAPTHIRMTSIINVGLVTKFTCMLLNPADREELAIKNDVTHSPKSERSSNKVDFCSKKK